MNLYLIQRADETEVDWSEPRGHVVRAMSPKAALKLIGATDAAIAASQNVFSSRGAMRWAKPTLLARRVRGEAGIILTDTQSD